MMMAFSESCERNKQSILDILTVELRDCCTALEVGSGTGQHAVHFASGMPHVEWQPTDRTDELPTLAARIAAEAPPNVRTPLPLDVRDTPWPFSGPFNAVFSANTLHIMSWDSVRYFFQGAGQMLDEYGLLCIYGPFLYDDVETLPSNVAFDQWLRARDPESGIRAFEAVNALAGEQSLVLKADYPMPANNQLLVWQRV
jgi:cyclopropane fatty-acyl-phospholipid synthase-like methyltransferase